MKHLLKRESILYVGKVCGISGIKIWVEVAKKKNDSFLLFDGDIVRNIGINSIVEIRKGFLSIVGIVVGEKVEESKEVQKAVTKNQIPLDHNKRIVEVSLLGYFDEKGKFTGGTKEFPLISSDVFILVGDKLQNLYNACSQDWSISVAMLESSEKIFRLPIDLLMVCLIVILLFLVIREAESPIPWHLCIMLYSKHWKKKTQMYLKIILILQYLISMGNTGILIV